MFLDAMTGGTNVGEAYSFVPYNYGPMSAQIYSDLETLVAEDLVEEVPVQGQSWSRYMATEKGMQAGRELMSRQPSDEVAQSLYRIKKEVAAKTFKALLEDVYDRYPEYAEKSVFRRDD
jgi:uncharacterized protein YwgA